MVRVVFRSWLKDDHEGTRPETLAVEMPVIPRVGEQVALGASETTAGRVCVVEAVSYMMLNDTLGQVVIDLKEEKQNEEKRLDELPPEDKMVP